MRLILYLLLAKAVLWIAASLWPDGEGEPTFIGQSAPAAAPTAASATAASIAPHGAGADSAARLRYALSRETA